MSTYLKVSAMAVLVTAIMAAAPMCITDTYADYQLLGAGGCTIGNETFSNFTDLIPHTSLGVTPIAPALLLVTPTTIGDESTLTFTYGTAASPTTIILADNSQQFGFDFTYEALAPITLVLTGMQNVSTFSNTSPGSVSFTKNAQAISGGPIFTSAVSDGGTSNLSGSYSGPVTTITSPNNDYLIKDAISLQAQTGAVSNSGFANNFFTAPPVTTTPEPPASVLIGSGLVLVAALTRKAAERRRRLTA